MTNEVLRNGVAHTVTTSLVTNNAVLPQNIFIKEAAPAPHDAASDGAELNANTPANSGEFEQTASGKTPKAAQDYPVSTDVLHTNDALATTKSYIRDNIQALKNLAHADNWHHSARDKFSKNIEQIASEHITPDNKQGLQQHSVSDNFQNLGITRSIEDNKLYLEKKSIKSNRQVVAANTLERAAPTLASPGATNSSNLSPDALSNQATGVQKGEQSPPTDSSSNADNEFQMRIKKLKRHVRDVDNSLHDIDPEK